MKKTLLSIIIASIFTVSAFCADAKNVGKFTTTNLAGTTVTENVFSKADVTVLNAWGTFCGPCINEMPELAAWAKSMPKEVQLIGLVVDVSSGSDKKGIDQAKKILTKAGADFENIVASKDFSNFLKNIQFVPTTFIINKNGEIIGEPIIGAKVESYKTAVEKYLNEQK